MATPRPGSGRIPVAVKRASTKPAKSSAGDLLEAHHRARPCRTAASAPSIALHQARLRSREHVARPGAGAAPRPAARAPPGASDAWPPSVNEAIAWNSSSAIARAPASHVGEPRRAASKTSGGEPRDVAGACARTGRTPPGCAGRRRPGRRAPRAARREAPREATPRARSSAAFQARRAPARSPRGRRRRSCSCSPSPRPSARPAGRLPRAPGARARTCRSGAAR